MYMDHLGDSYKRQGIGRQAVEFFKELSGSSVVVSGDGGQRKDNDGSHLTQDAPAFVAQMREEGIIDGCRPPRMAMADEISYDSRS